MDERKRRILLVDDEPSIIKIVRKQLELAGYEVLIAANGPDALAQAQSAGPDLIILDRMLPQLNGTEVCQKLKASPELARIPILMLSANARHEDQLASLQHGADAYLTKPFALQELLERIKALLDRPAGRPDQG